MIPWRLVIVQPKAPTGHLSPYKCTTCTSEIYIKYRLSGLMIIELLGKIRHTIAQAVRKLVFKVSHTDFNVSPCSLSSHLAPSRTLEQVSSMPPRYGCRHQVSPSHHLPPTTSSHWRVHCRHRVEPPSPSWNKLWAPHPQPQPSTPPHQLAALAVLLQLTCCPAWEEVFGGCLRWRMIQTCPQCRPREEILQDLMMYSIFLGALSPIKKSLENLLCHRLWDLFDVTLVWEDGFANPRQVSQW